MMKQFAAALIAIGTTSVTVGAWACTIDAHQNQSNLPPNGYIRLAVPFQVPEGGHVSKHPIKKHTNYSTEEMSYLSLADNTPRIMEYARCY